MPRIHALSDRIEPKSAHHSEVHLLGVLVSQESFSNAKDRILQISGVFSGTGVSSLRIHSRALGGPELDHVRYRHFQFYMHASYLQSRHV